MTQASSIFDWNSFHEKRYKERSSLDNKVPQPLKQHNTPLVLAYFWKKKNNMSSSNVADPASQPLTRRVITGGNDHKTKSQVLYDDANGSVR